MALDGLFLLQYSACQRRMWIVRWKMPIGRLPTVTTTTILCDFYYYYYFYYCYYHFEPSCGESNYYCNVDVDDVATIAPRSTGDSSSWYRCCRPMVVQQRCRIQQRPMPRVRRLSSSVDDAATRDGSGTMRRRMEDAHPWRWDDPYHHHHHDDGHLPVSSGGKPSSSSSSLLGNYGVFVCIGRSDLVV